MKTQINSNTNKFSQHSHPLLLLTVYLFLLSKLRRFHHLHHHINNTDIRNSQLSMAHIILHKYHSNIKNSQNFLITKIRQ